MGSLVPFAQYFWEPKTALKNEVFFFNFFLFFFNFILFLNFTIL